MTSAFTSAECFSSSPLSHSLADNRQRLTDYTMSSLLTTVTTVLTGANYHEWHVLRPVLLASWDGEQRRFGGQGDLDCNAPRVWWLRTLLRGKVEVQGTRPSKPKKKGMCPIGNSRGIAVRVRRLLLGSGKALDTFLCPLHESGLVKGERM